MAPARSNRRTRTNTAPQDTTVQLPDDPNINSHLFIDPMLGTPLAMYVEKDVDYRDIVVQMIEVHHRLYLSIIIYGLNKSHRDMVVQLRLAIVASHIFLVCAICLYSRL